MKGYLHIFLLILVGHRIQAQDSSSNVTFAALPPIQVSMTFRPIISSNDGRLILSNQYENLVLQSFMVNSTLHTKITLRFLNRTSPNYETSYLVTLQGMWNHVASSANSYSCSVIYENTMKSLALLLLDRNQPLFKVLKTLPLSFFTNQSLTLSLLREQFEVSDKCQLITHKNLITNQRIMYRAHPDWSTIYKVSYPTAWNPQNYSADILFTVSSNKLYRYNSTTYEIQQLFTFPQFYDRYIVKHNLNRIVVSAARTSIYINLTTPTTNITNYTVFVFNLIQGQIKVVYQFDVIGLIQQTQLNEVVTSPKLTKVAFGFYDQSNNFNLILKHIDYTLNRAIDIEFKELPRFSKTIYGIDRSKELFLGDSFAVVRNGSRFNVSSNSSGLVEETYQFIGNQVVFLRSRSLINKTDFKEMLSFVRTGIDSSFQDRLIVLNIYNISSKAQYTVEDYHYGNLAYVRKILKQASAPYISFIEPIYDSLFVDPYFFLWTYTTYMSSINSTSLDIFVSVDTAASHLAATTVVEGGSWRVLSQNQECLALGSDSSYNFYRLNRNTMTFQQVNKTNVLLSAINITNQTVWSTSTDCTRLRVGTSLFVLSSAGNFITVNNSANFSFIAIDLNLTTSIAEDGSFWKFDPVWNGYIQLTSPFKNSFPAGSSISSVEGGIIVWGTSNSSAWVLGFAYSSSEARRFFSYQFSQFSSVPKVYFSSNLSKIIIIGSLTSASANQTILLLDAFSLDFKGRTFRNISIPKQTVKDLKSTYIWLDDLFLYIRQPNISATYISGFSENIAKQFVYYFAGGSIPIKIFGNEIRSSLNTTWIKSMISHRSQSSFLMTETLERDALSWKRIVRAQQISGNYNTYQSNQNFVIQIYNDQPQVCAVGCLDCSCSSCLPGYVLDDLTTNRCRPCALSCTFCGASDPTKCEQCMEGSFLNSSSGCEPCAYQCLKCNSSASQCLSCRPGYFFNNILKSCLACPKNCFNCKDAQTCVICKKGFVLAGYKCRKCQSSCSECYYNNITKCTSCGKGLQQINAACSSCPTNCLECSGTRCAICVDGYVADNMGSCITKCQLPCLTCLKNQPALCTGCFSGASISNGTCVIDLACNANSSCVNCGQGFNYILIATEAGAYCLPCPSISNCLQCSSFDSYTCSICKESFYVNEEGACSVCSTNCSSCKSDSICTGCRPGFTLTTGYTEGNCISCQVPCLTCSGQPTYCTSCNSSSHVRFNSQCRNKTRILFRFVLNEADVTILNSIDSIVLGLLLLLGEPTDNIAVINFDQIVSGSTVIAGSAEPSTQSINVAFSNLGKGLQGGIPTTTYQVTQSSVTLQGSLQSVPNGEINKDKSSANENLLLGILIPIGIICFGLFILAVMIYKNNRGSETSLQRNKGGSDAMIASSDQIERDTPDVIAHRVLPENYDRHK